MSVNARINFDVEIHTWHRLGLRVVQCTQQHVGVKVFIIVDKQVRSIIYPIVRTQVRDMICSALVEDML